MDKRKTSEVEVVKFQEEIEKMNKMIKDNKEKTLEKEVEKRNLNDQTIQLRANITE